MEGKTRRGRVTFRNPKKFHGIKKTTRNGNGVSHESSNQHDFIQRIAAAAGNAIPNYAS
jgi:hypothetical protein